MPLEPYDVAKLADIKARLYGDADHTWGQTWYEALATRDIIVHAKWLVSYCELLSSAVTRLEENAHATLRRDLARMQHERWRFGLPLINENEQKGEGV